MSLGDAETDDVYLLRVIFVSPVALIFPDDEAPDSWSLLTGKLHTVYVLKQHSKLCLKL